jgi:Na+/phosphate symporter
VLTVIAGWFFTAFLAFTVAFIVAILISWGGLIVIIVLVGLAVLLLVRTHIFHRKKTEKAISSTEQSESFAATCIKNITTFITDSGDIFKNIIEGLIKEDRRSLKKLLPRIEELNLRIKSLKDNIHKTISQLGDEKIEAGPHYVQELDYMREMAHCLTFLEQPVYKHIDNNHKGMIPAQQEELNELVTSLQNFSESIRKSIEENNFDNLNKIAEEQQKILDRLNGYRKNQIKRIKSEMVGTRNSSLYINILQESKNYVLFIMNLLKSHRDLVEHSK